MPDQLYGGSRLDFADSVASEIESALRAVRLEAGLGDTPPDEDLRLLFIAIGRGVVAHLRKHEAAFAIRVEAPLPRDTHPTIHTR